MVLFTRRFLTTFATWWSCGENQETGVLQARVIALEVPLNWQVGSGSIGLALIWRQRICIPCSEGSIHLHDVYYTCGHRFRSGHGKGCGDEMYNIHISASGSDFHFSISEYQGLNCVHILQTSPETAQVLVNHANDRSGLKIASACERPPWRKKRHHSVGGVTQLGVLVVDSLEKKSWKVVLAFVKEFGKWK